MQFSQNKIVIVSLSVTQLRIGLANAGRQSHRLAEIEHRLGNRMDFARRYLLGVRGKKGVCRNGNFVVKDIACRKSSEIEVGMGAEADRCRLRGLSPELEAERMVL